MDKLEVLRQILKQLPGAVVAYSGGVDSTFLAYVAHQTLGDKMLAVTAVSPTYPEDQLTEAQAVVDKYGFRHTVIQTNEFDDPQFTKNPSNRCYFCKHALFEDLTRIANEEGPGVVVLDGANVDDGSDHRPGHQAARELGIRSPLQEAGFTKADIRRYSQEFALPTWDKPAYACLASRIPYGREITPDILQRIDLAETFLKNLGFREFRVRDHHPVARIEIGKSELDAAWQQRERISAKLHELGFPYVSLDLDGFRSGSMNAVLSQEQLHS